MASSTRSPGARARILGLLLVALAALSAASPVQAGQARHVRVEIHDTFVDGFLSEACGTEVVTTFDASLNVTLVYNDDGLIVREIDPSGGGKVTYSAPETGNSFSYPFNTAIIDYGSGAVVGSQFTIAFVGLIGHVPGYLESDAGRGVFAGIVKGFDENGIPRLEFTHLVSFRGHGSDFDQVVDATCDALTA